jgi:kelch-like protein 2/3
LSGNKKFADMYGCVDLNNDAVIEKHFLFLKTYAYRRFILFQDTYVEQHFSNVVQFEEFLNLTHQQVRSLIKSDRLFVPTEEKVCKMNRKLKTKKPPQN